MLWPAFITSRPCWHPAKCQQALAPHCSSAQQSLTNNLRMDLQNDIDSGRCGACNLRCKLGGCGLQRAPRHCSTGASLPREPKWLPAVGSILAFRCALQPVAQLAVVCIAPHFGSSPLAVTFSFSSHPAAAQSCEEARNTSAAAIARRRLSSGSCCLPPQNAEADDHGKGCHALHTKQCETASLQLPHL